MEKVSQTEQWTISVGTVSGYAFEGKPGMDAAAMAELYRACAERVFQETGVYLSAVAEESRMLYRSEWGCPAGGEPGYTLRGTRNPAFAEKAPYRDALLRLTRMLKEELKQSAVYLEIRPVELFYFDGKESDHE